MRLVNLCLMEKRLRGPGAREPKRRRGRLKRTACNHSGPLRVSNFAPKKDSRRGQWLLRCWQQDPDPQARPERLGRWRRWFRAADRRINSPENRAAKKLSRHVAAMRRQRQFSGATEIRAIGGLPRFEAPAWTINPATPQPGRVVISSRSLNELAALLNRGIGSSPRHNRYPPGQILRL